MYTGFFLSGEHTSTLNNIFSSSISPFDISWVSFSKHDYFSPIDVKKLPVLLDFSCKFSMSRIVFEHINHVVKWNKWVVDGDNLSSFGQSRSQDQTANSAKSIDSDLRHDEIMIIGDQQSKKY